MAKKENLMSMYYKVVIGKDEVSLAFYYDPNTDQYQFKIDELDGGQGIYMNVVKKSKGSYHNGSSNYTPPKKKRK